MNLQRKGFLYRSKEGTFHGLVIILSQISMRDEHLLVFLLLQKAKSKQIIITLIRIHQRSNPIESIPAQKPLKFQTRNATQASKLKRIQLAQIKKPQPLNETPSLQPRRENQIETKHTINQNKSCKIKEKIKKKKKTQARLKRHNRLNYETHASADIE